MLTPHSMLVILFKQTFHDKTKMIYRILIPLLIFLSCSVSSIEFQDPWRILTNAHSAAKELNYQGTYHFTDNKQSQSVEITHALHGLDEYTRMILMDGSPGEMLSDGKNVIVYHSSDQNVHIKQKESHNLFPSVIPDNIENLKSVYTLHFDKIDRVADRAAQIVALIPKDNYRHAYRFWIDLKTSLLLKMIISDESNEVVEQAAFTKLNLTETQKDLSWYAPKIDFTKDYLNNENTIDLPVQKFWQFSSIPKGFKEISVKASRNSGFDMLSHHLVFSDGLSYLSVFIQPVQSGHKPKVGNISMGRTNVCARYYNGYQIMSVGAVPQKTCELFTESISF